mgnify:CR=1 FL=1
MLTFIYCRSIPRLLKPCTRKWIIIPEKKITEAGINQYTETIEADNITNATIKYAQKVNASLIAIMTEQETTASNILLGPYAQQMVNHSPIPVLSIQPKEIYSISTR